MQLSRSQYYLKPKLASTTPAMRRTLAQVVVNSMLLAWSVATVPQGHEDLACWRDPPALNSTSLRPDDRVTLRIAVGVAPLGEAVRLPLGAPRLGHMASGVLCDVLTERGEGRSARDSRYGTWLSSSNALAGLGPHVVFLVVTASDYQRCAGLLAEVFAPQRPCFALAGVRHKVAIPFKSRSHAGALDKLAWPSYLPRTTGRVLTLDLDTEFAFKDGLRVAWDRAFERFVPGLTVMGAAAEPSSFGCRFGDRAVQFGFNSGVVAWDLDALRAAAPATTPATTPTAVPATRHKRQRRRRRQLGAALAHVKVAGGDSGSGAAASAGRTHRRPNRFPGEDLPVPRLGSSGEERTEAPQGLARSATATVGRRHRRPASISSAVAAVASAPYSAGSGRVDGNGGHVDQKHLTLFGVEEEDEEDDGGVSWWWREVAAGGVNVHSLGDQNVFNFFARLHPDRFAVLPCELNFGQVGRKRRKARTPC